MGIKTVLKKLGNFFNHGTHPNGERLTPAEVELASYKKREYLDNVKKELAHYRLKNSDELLRGTGLNDKSTIFNTPQFGGAKHFKGKKKKCSILGGSSKGGGSLW